jgi:hypothetical protein
LTRQAVVVNPHPADTADAPDLETLLEKTEETRRTHE